MATEENKASARHALEAAWNRGTVAVDDRTMWDVWAAIVGGPARLRPSVRWLMTYGGT